MLHEGAASTSTQELNRKHVSLLMQFMQTCMPGAGHACSRMHPTCQPLPAVLAGKWPPAATHFQAGWAHSTSTTGPLCVRSVSCQDSAVEADLPRGGSPCSPDMVLEVPGTKAKVHVFGIDHRHAHPHVGGYIFVRVFANTQTWIEHEFVMRRSVCVRMYVSVLMEGYVQGMYVFVCVFAYTTCRRASARLTNST